MKTKYYVPKTCMKLKYKPLPNPVPVVPPRVRPPGFCPPNSPPPVVPPNPPAV